jgi:hypothetical protein
MSKRIGTVQAQVAEPKGGSPEEVEGNPAHVHASVAGVELCVELDETALLTPTRARELSELLDAGAREAERMAREASGDGENFYQRLVRCEEEARAALRTMGAKLLTLSEQSVAKDLQVEARRSLLLARTSFDKGEQIDAALVVADCGVDYVRLWRAEHDAGTAFDEQYLQPALDACRDAVAALCALADAWLAKEEERGC